MDSSSIVLGLSEQWSFEFVNICGKINLLYSLSLACNLFQKRAKVFFLVIYFRRGLKVHILQLGKKVHILQSPPQVGKVNSLF